MRPPANPSLVKEGTRSYSHSASLAAAYYWQEVAGVVRFSSYFFNVSIPPCDMYPPATASLTSKAFFGDFNAASTFSG